VPTAQNSHKERQVQGKGVKSQPSNASGRLIRLGWSFVEQDDHASAHQIEVEAMFCTWCELLSHQNKTDRGSCIC
jgi:hypothetical protein